MAAGSRQRVLMLMSVTVRMLNGQNHIFNLPDDLTVWEFKELISDTVLIPAHSQRLLFQGRVMQNDTMLRDVKGKVIHLVQGAPPSCSPLSSTTTSARPQITLSSRPQLGENANTGQEYHVSGSASTVAADNLSETWMDTSSPPDLERTCQAENREQQQNSRDTAEGIGINPEVFIALEVATFVDRVTELSHRVIPFLQRYQDLMRRDNYPVRSEEYVNAQNVISRINGLFQGLSLLLHRLTDVTVDGSSDVRQPAVAHPPLSDTPVPLQATPTVGVVFPIHMNVRTRPDSRRNRHGSHHSTPATASTAKSKTTATQNSTDSSLSGTATTAASSTGTSATNSCQMNVGTRQGSRRNRQSSHQSTPAAISRTTATQNSTDSSLSGTATTASSTGTSAASTCQVPQVPPESLRGPQITASLGNSMDVVGVLPASITVQDIRSVVNQAWLNVGSDFAAQRVFNNGARINASTNLTSTSSNPSFSVPAAGAATTSSDNHPSIPIHLQVLSQLLVTMGMNQAGPFPPELGPVISGIMQSVVADRPSFNCEFLYSNKTEPSIIMSLLETVISRMGLRDLIYLIMGNAQVLNQVRGHLQGCVKSLVDQYGSVEQVVEAALNEINADIQLLQSLVQEKEDIDMARSLHSCLRANLLTIFAAINSSRADSQEDFGSHLFGLCKKMLAESIGLCVQCLREGLFGFVNMVRGYARRLRHGRRPVFINWIIQALQNILLFFYRNHLVEMGDIVGYVVNKSNRTMETASQKQNQSRSKTSSQVIPNISHTAEPAVNLPSSLGTSHTARKDATESPALLLPEAEVPSLGTALSGMVGEIVGQEPSVIMSLLETVASQMDLTDLIYLIRGNARGLTRVIGHLQGCVKSLIDWYGSVEQVVVAALKEMNVHVQLLLRSVRVREDVYMAHSLCRCVRANLRIIVAAIISSSEDSQGEFCSNLLGLWKRMMAESIKLCLKCLQDGRSGFFNMIQNYVRLLTQGRSPLLINWMTRVLQDMLWSFYKNHEVKTSDIKGYVAMKSNAFVPNVRLLTQGRSPLLINWMTRVLQDMLWSFYKNHEVKTSDIKGYVAMKSNANEKAASQKNKSRSKTSSALIPNVSHTAASVSHTSSSPSTSSSAPMDTIHSPTSQSPVATMSSAHYHELGNIPRCPPDSLKRVAGVEVHSDKESMAQEATNNLDLQAGLEREVTAEKKSRIMSDQDFSSDNFPVQNSSSINPDITG